MRSSSAFWGHVNGHIRSCLVDEKYLSLAGICWYSITCLLRTHSLLVCKRFRLDWTYRNGYLTWLWKIFDYQRVYYCRSKKNDPHLQNDDSVPAADLRNESCTLGGWYLSSPARWCAWCRCLDCEHLRVAEVAPDLPSTYLHCKKKDTQDPRYMRILPLFVYCILFLLVSPWALHIVFLFLFVFCV